VNTRIEKIVNRIKLMHSPITIRLLIFFSVRSRARKNMIAKLGIVEAADIAEEELFTNPGFEENFSLKKAAAVVNENHATKHQYDVKTRFLRSSIANPTTVSRLSKGMITQHQETKVDEPPVC